MTTYNATFLDLIATPLVLMSESGDSVLGLNVAARRVFTVERPPAPATAFFGDASAQIRAWLSDPSSPQRSSPLTVACTTPAGPRRLVLTAGKGPADVEGVIVSIEDRSDDVLDGSAGDKWRKTLLEVLESLPVGLEIYDEEMVQQFANAESAKMFGYTAEEVRDLEDWWQVAYPDPEYREQARQAWFDAVALSRTSRADVRMREWDVTCKDGSRKTVAFRYRAIADQHALLFWDMTEHRRLESELRRVAETDVLTGVSERRRFIDAVAAALRDAARTGEPLSLLMLDIDHFKAINDAFGHSGGDEVLRTAARRLSDGVRIDDMVGRLGGEEFAILLPRLHGAGAREVAERLRAALSDRPFEVAGKSLPVRASIGGAQATGTPDSVDALLERADQALYAAKRGGRNRVVFHGDPP